MVRILSYDTEDTSDMLDALQKVVKDIQKRIYLMLVKQKRSTYKTKRVSRRIILI